MKRRAQQVAASLQLPVAKALLAATPHGKLTTLTRLQVTDDLRSAVAWIAGWQLLEPREQGQVTHALQMAVRDSSTSKFTPHLTIHDDDSAAYAAHIQRLIEDDTSTQV